MVDGRFIEHMACSPKQLPINIADLISEENGKKMKGKLTFAQLVLSSSSSGDTEKQLKPA